MADLIDRRKLLDGVDGNIAHLRDIVGEHPMLNRAIDLLQYTRDFIAAQRTVDAVEIDVLAKWLYEIALNNIGYPVEDMAAACVEIIKRLDGLRKFAVERREEDAAD